jgi:hypothetical protein
MEHGNRLLIPLAAFKWVALAALVGVAVVSSWLSRLGFSPGVSFSLAGLAALCVFQPRLWGRVMEALQAYRVWRKVLRGDLAPRNRLLVIAASMAVWFGLLVRGWYPADAALLALVVNEVGACTVAQELIAVLHGFSRRPYEWHMGRNQAAWAQGGSGRPSGRSYEPRGSEAAPAQPMGLSRATVGSHRSLEGPIPGGSAQDGPRGH